MARSGYPSDKQDQFMLRLPEGMRSRIKAQAEAHGRSMNTEIVTRLTETFDRKHLFSDDLVRKYLTASETEIEALKQSQVLLLVILEEAAHAIRLASQGDRERLERLIEREGEQRMLGRILAASVDLGED